MDIEQFSKFIAPVIIILLASPIYAASNTQRCLEDKSNKLKVCVSLPMQGKKWHVITLAFTMKNNHIRNFLPKGQSLHNWKQMVQLRIINLKSYPTKIKTAEEYTQHAKNSLNKNCPKSRWTTLSSQPNTSLYDYQTKACPLWGSLYRVAKISGHKHYLLEVSYTKKGFASQKEKQQFLNILKTAKFYSST